VDNDLEILLNSRGQGCTCEAWYAGECGCPDAVWPENYIQQAIEEIKRLRLALKQEIKLSNFLAKKLDDWRNVANLFYEQRDEWHKGEINYASELYEKTLNPD
jgi:hypothetical protein